MSDDQAEPLDAILVRARRAPMPTRLHDIALQIGMTWATETTEYRQYLFDTVREAADEIESLRSQLADLIEGRRIVLPVSKEHAQAMHLVATKLL